MLMRRGGGDDDDGAGLATAANINRTGYLWPARTWPDMDGPDLTIDELVGVVVVIGAEAGAGILSRSAQANGTCLLAPSCEHRSESERSQLAPKVRSRPPVSLGPSDCRSSRAGCTARDSRRKVGRTWRKDRLFVSGQTNFALSILVCRWSNGAAMCVRLTSELTRATQTSAPAAGDRRGEQIKFSRRRNWTIHMLSRVTIEFCWPLLSFIIAPGGPQQWRPVNRPAIGRPFG